MRFFITEFIEYKYIVVQYTFDASHFITNKKIVRLLNCIHFNLFFFPFENNIVQTDEMHGTYNFI